MWLLSFRWLAVPALLMVLLCLPVTAGHAQDIVYTFGGEIRVLDLSSPPPGSGPPIPGADPLGMDGATILLTCVIDSSTLPSFEGPNADGFYARYNAGVATLVVSGSVGGGADGTYVDTPCSVRLDDHPIGSAYGGDVLSVTTRWNLGLPFPDEFQVTFAELENDTFTGIRLQPFAASDVIGFIGVNFSGSPDAFYFADGSGSATGTLVSLTPSERIGELIDVVLESADLRRGQKQSLIVKLANARRLLDGGRVRPAVRLLRAFINRVEALIRSAALTPAEGQPLIDEAEAIVEQILGS